MENQIGLLSYADVPNADTFHYVASKKKKKEKRITLANIPADLIRKLILSSGKLSVSRLWI